MNVLRRMYEAGECTDCVIECDTKEFSVHKCALIANSKVFAAMFSHEDTTESIESRIRLADTSATTIDQMLMFMYSGALPDDLNSEHAFALMEAAEKWMLDGLKDFCQDLLISRVSFDNICNFLPLADMNNAIPLRDACIQMLRKNLHLVLGCPAWEELKDANPRLTTEVLEKICIASNSKHSDVPRQVQDLYYRPAP